MTARRWFYVAFGFAYVILLVECVLLIGLLRDQSEQSAQGEQARLQQCQMRTISLKGQRWFYAHGVITRAELATVERSIPTAAMCRELAAQQ